MQEKKMYFVEILGKVHLARSQEIFVRFWKSTFSFPTFRLFLSFMSWVPYISNTKTQEMINMCRKML